MRKLILLMHVSLDGFVCGPNGEQDWMTMGDDEAGRYLISDFQTTVDTMLVGRVLYEGFATVWPSIATDPASPSDLVAFANWMEDTPKIVFSKTLETVEWKNSSLAKGDLADEVARLKQQPGGDMVVFGGAGFAAALTEQNLVDEYRIKLEPVVLGEGRPLFKNVSDRINLTIIKGKTFSSGVVGLCYQFKRK